MSTASLQFAGPTFTNALWRYDIPTQTWLYQGGTPGYGQSSSVFNPNVQPCTFVCVTNDEQSTRFGMIGQRGGAGMVVDSAGKLIVFGGGNFALGVSNGTCLFYAHLCIVCRTLVFADRMRFGLLRRFAFQLFFVPALPNFVRAKPWQRHELYVFHGRVPVWFGHVQT